MKIRHEGPEFMTSPASSSPFPLPTLMPIALPPSQASQQPTGQQPAAQSPATPPNPIELATMVGLAASGFKFADAPTGQTQDQWIDAARNSDDPTIRAQFQMLSLMAGGRGDNAAIKQVLERYYALTTAQTASEIAAADKGMMDQIAVALDGLNPVNRLMDMAQPAVAGALRASGLNKTEWGSALQKILDTPGTAYAFREGFRTGVLEGGKDMVVGLATIGAKAVRLAADHSILGAAGDTLRKITGPLQGPLDAAIPSFDRGLQTDKAILDTGQKIGTYLANRTPEQVGADVTTFIGKQWDSLKASHAAAAKQGPEAEARWWGQTTGRITFEVAATFVPVAGQAGKVSTVAKGADLAADGLRAADKVVDGVRAGETVADGARAGGKVVDSAPPAGVIATTLRTITGGKGANTVVWTVDTQGRLVSARASLSEVFKGLERSADETAAQASTAAKGIKGDHGGHAVPHRFLGDQGEINMFPQNGVPDGALKNFNGSAFKTLENELADWVEAGGKVDYEVKFSDFDPKFPDRPNTVRIEYKVYNDKGVEVYRNRDRFMNEAGQVFDRMSKSDIMKKLAS